MSHKSVHPKVLAGSYETDRHRRRYWSWTERRRSHHQCGSH